MMMKKTTSALAVAALLGTGAASAATFQVNDDTSLTVGGDIYFAYYDAEGSNTSFQDNGSDLYFAGEQTHANGITTSFYLDLDEFGNFGNKNAVGYTEGVTATDEYHIGFAGDFGQIKIGNEGDVTGPVFDVVDVSEGSGVGNLPDGGASTEVIQYYSNDFNGVSFAVQSQVNGEDQQNNDSSLSLAGYVEATLGDVTLAAGYADRADTVDDETIGVMASTTISGVSLAANFVDESNNGNDRSLFGVSGSYSYGFGSLYGAMQTASVDGGTDSNRFVAGVNYTVTPNSYVYAEMARQDQPNDVGDETVIGINYGW